MARKRGTKARSEALKKLEKQLLDLYHEPLANIDQHDNDPLEVLGSFVTNDLARDGEKENPILNRIDMARMLREWLIQPIDGSPSSRIVASVSGRSKIVDQLIREVMLAVDHFNRVNVTGEVIGDAIAGALSKAAGQEHGAQGGKAKAKKTQDEHAIWRRNALDWSKQYPRKKPWEIARDLAPKADVAVRTFYKVILPAFRSDS